MSLSTAFNIISSSFAANAAQTAVVSNNIANVNTPGYSREIANLVTNSYGGVDVASVTRDANAALTEQVSTSTSQAATQQAISDGLSTLAATVDDSSSTSSTSGADQNGASPSAMLANLQSALDDLRRLADLVVRRRRRGHRRAPISRRRSTRETRRSTRCASRPTRTWPRRSRPSIRCSPSSRPPTTRSSADFGHRRQRRERRGHARFDRDPARPADRRHHVDRRQRLDVDLHRQRRHAVPGHAAHRLLHADADATSTARAARRSRSTACRSPAPIRRCRSSRARSPATRRCATRSRRNIRRSSTRSPAASSTPSPRATSRAADAALAARPFHHARGDEPALDLGATGLAAAIEVNPNVDPSQGGDATLLRDGGISDPEIRPISTTRPARRVTPDATPGARRRDSARRRASTPSAGLGTSASLADYANASVSWLQGENQQASNASDLPERARHPGDLGAVERDRRQSRRRDDQHAQPRKLLRLVGEASDHGQRACSPLCCRPHDNERELRLDPVSRQQPRPAGAAGAGVSSRRR